MFCGIFSFDKSFGKLWEKFRNKNVRKFSEETVESVKKYWIIFGRNFLEIVKKFREFGRACENCMKNEKNLVKILEFYGKGKKNWNFWEWKI